MEEEQKNYSVIFDCFFVHLILVNSVGLSSFSLNHGFSLPSVVVSRRFQTRSEAVVLF